MYKHSYDIHVEPSIDGWIATVTRDDGEYRTYSSWSVNHLLDGPVVGWLTGYED